MLLHPRPFDCLVQFLPNAAFPSQLGHYTLRLPHKKHAKRRRGLDPVKQQPYSLVTIGQHEFYYFVVQKSETPQILLCERKIQSVAESSHLLI